MNDWLSVLMTELGLYHDPFAEPKQPPAPPSTSEIVAGLNLTAEIIMQDIDASAHAASIHVRRSIGQQFRRAREELGVAK